VARACIILRPNEVPARNGQGGALGEAQPRPPLLDRGAPGRRLIFVEWRQSEGVPVPAQGSRAEMAVAGRDVEGSAVRQGGPAQEQTQVPAAAGRGVVGGAAPQGGPAQGRRQVPAAAGRSVVGGVGHRRVIQAAPRLALPFREEADDPEEPRVPPHRRDRPDDRHSRGISSVTSTMTPITHDVICAVASMLLVVVRRT